MSNVSTVYIDSFAIAHLSKIATFINRDQYNSDMGNVYFFTHENYWYAFTFHPHFGAFYKLHEVETLPEGQTEANITFRVADPVFQTWVKLPHPMIEWNEEAKNWVINVDLHSSFSVEGLYDVWARKTVQLLTASLAKKKLVPSSNCDLTVEQISIITPHKKAILSFWRAEGENGNNPIFVGANMQDVKYARDLGFLGILMGFDCDENQDTRRKKINNFFKETDNE